MGYSDKFYYGQCKLIVDTNKTPVSVTDGEHTWEDGNTFMLPATNNYLVKAGEAQEEIFLGFGEYKTIKL